MARGCPRCGGVVILSAASLRFLFPSRLRLVPYGEGGVGVGVVKCKGAAPSVPDLVAFVAFEAAAAQAVAAFEVAAPPSAPGAVALSAARVRREPGTWRPVMVHRVGQALERGVGRGLVEPAVDHHLPELDVEVLQLGCGGRSSVPALGLPIWLEGGRMCPRAPGLVLAVISHT